LSQSINEAITSLANGNDSGAYRLWDEYFHRLVRLARVHFRTNRRRVYDEEDAAISAFNSFCIGVQRGRYDDLTDADSLWRLLMVITSNKVAHRMRDQNRLKRGGGQLKGESGIFAAGKPLGLDAMTADGPTPEFAIEFADLCTTLVNSLNDPALQRIAELKLEGLTNVEIATKLNCVKRTVERKLNRIHEHWSNYNSDDGICAEKSTCGDQTDET